MANFGEYGGDHIVPVMGGATQSIQSFLEKPEFVFGVRWITDGWADNGEFVIGQVCIAKCVFAIALLQDSLGMDSFDNE